MCALLNINEVNDLNEEQFQSIFGNIIELCTDAAAKVYSLKPFKDVENLYLGFYNYLDELPFDGKVNILRLHPDLAGKLAEKGQLTSESTQEQHSAGLDQLTNEQKDVINYYNKHYKEKFGFPFIICARENKVKSIIEGLMRRYNNYASHEVTTGINEVKKICKLRILDLVEESE